uniref:Single-strand selective monofunctional uracil DNA glycosylase n=1 Tax=Piliocolobus tephrosceles TaxID=591936 RepID=A0A8C9H7N8_9PRIM
MVVAQTFSLGTLHEPAGTQREPQLCPQGLAEGFLEEEFWLNAELSQLQFLASAGLIHHPVEYCIRATSQLCDSLLPGPKEVLFLGTNPGPFMNMVWDWLGIGGPVLTPPQEHPKQSVLGLGCSVRGECGARLWGFSLEPLSREPQYLRSVG